MRIAILLTFFSLFVGRAYSQIYFHQLSVKTDVTSVVVTADMDNSGTLTFGDSLLVTVSFDMRDSLDIQTGTNIPGCNGNNACDYFPVLFDYTISNFENGCFKATKNPVPVSSTNILSTGVWSDYWDSNFDSVSLWRAVVPICNYTPNNTTNGAKLTASITFEYKGIYFNVSGNGCVNGATSFAYKKTIFGHANGDDNCAQNYYTNFTPSSISILPGALPIRFVSFSGVHAAEKKQNILSFTVETDGNQSSIIVEKSIDGLDFHSFAEVDIHSFNGRNNLSQIDNFPFAGATYYRLKLLDNSGTAKYSNVIRVEGSSSDDFMVYPNPTIGTQVNVMLDAKIESHSTFHLFDLTGRHLFEKKIILSQGKNLLSITLPQNLLPGIYVCEINGVRKRVSIMH